jgi:3-hydroxyisobutyrate dehydrogenase-like beta-hydroxyacid dehydrogenase
VGAAADDTRLREDLGSLTRRMAITVAIVSPGDMGEAVGAVLTRGGARVAVCLAGRSARTRGLARDAGFVDVPSVGDLVREADLLLSIVPPAAAVDVAHEVAAALRATGARLVYVDCNAVAPSTVRQVESIVSATGSGFVDAGIVGGPPRGTPSPRFYASGPERDRFAHLALFGLDVRVMGARVGDASAVKMCYAALTKGTTAIATELLVAARRLDVYEHVVGAFAESDQLRQRTTGVATMPGKAHRWIAEMEQIARTFSEVGLSPRLFEGAAEIYRQVARSPLGAERPETVDRARGVDRTIDVLAADTTSTEE